MNIYNYIQIDPYSATPKYIQLSNLILSALSSGDLVKGDILPSINDLSAELEISRDTAEKGYRNLKHLGVLGSVPGKGYFIKSTDYKQDLKIFLLFNKLSAHKKILYDAFVEALGMDAIVDFYIYNNDFNLFKKIVTEKKEDYTHYVIIPHFVDDAPYAYDVINRLPKDKLVLLDKKIASINGHYGAVYEDFEKDIYKALERAIERLSNYHSLKLVFPTHSYYPKEIVDGFRHFCQQYAFKYEVINSTKDESPSGGEVYICVLEEDLVALIELIKEKHLQLGKDVGVISYNETPMKKIIMSGITTISTDFKEMGRLTAKMVTTNQIESISVPFTLILRDSL